MQYCFMSGLYFISNAAFAASAKNPGVISHSELIKVIGGLFLVLLIIVLLSWMVKRLNIVNLSTSKGFQSIASMTLGPKEKIILLKVSNKYLLIGVGAGMINVLHDFGEQLPDGFDVENKPRFAELLKSTIRNP